MQKIRAFCSRYGTLLLIFVFCLFVRLGIDAYKYVHTAERASEQAAEQVAEQAAAERAGEAVEDSFVAGVPGTIRSSDGRLSASQSVEDDAEGGARVVRITISNEDNGMAVGAFIAARAMDYQGVCFAPDSYDIWVQTADAGVYCMRYADGVWEKDPNAARPEGVVSRYDAQASGS